MFAFSSPIAEPLLLLLFGVLFLAVATGVHVRLTRKKSTGSQELELLGSETTSLPGSWQGR